MHAHMSVGGPLVDIWGIGTKMASLSYPANGTRLEADMVPLALTEWWHQVGC